MSAVSPLRGAGAAPRFTAEQQLALNGIRRRLDSGVRSVTLGGLAGTGKTTIATGIPGELGLLLERVAFCAYTGKAAAVLTGKLRAAHADRRLKATTIHGLIYRVQEQHCRLCPREQRPDEEGRLQWEGRCHGQADCGCELQSERVERLSRRDLIVVDEASMVDATIHQDLLSYGVPVLWIGDHGQLPPVRGSFHLMAEPDFRLETIHRQAADSPILRLAMQARQTGRIPFGDFSVPGATVTKTPRRRIELGLPEGAPPAWPPGLLLLCATNRVRVMVNRLARRHLGYPSEHPVRGDRVVCLRNDRTRGVSNGELGTVRQCLSAYGGGAWLEVCLDSGGLYERWVDLEQFGRRKTELGDGGSLGLWDYGYCLTVHKAQGSEAERVILLEEPLHWMGTEAPRWLYTAVTRARRHLEVIEWR